MQAADTHTNSSCHHECISKKKPGISRVRAITDAKSTRLVLKIARSDEIPRFSRVGSNLDYYVNQWVSHSAITVPITIPIRYTLHRMRTSIFVTVEMLALVITALYTPQ